jgi:hypothetical protein
MARCAAPGSNCATVGVGLSVSTLRQAARCAPAGESWPSPDRIGGLRHLWDGLGDVDFFRKWDEYHLTGISYGIINMVYT